MRKNRELTKKEFNKFLTRNVEKKYLNKIGREEFWQEYCDDREQNQVFEISRRYTKSGNPITRD
jgi:hypothetical protein